MNSHDDYIKKKFKDSIKNKPLNGLMVLDGVIKHAIDTAEEIKTNLNDDNEIYNSNIRAIKKNIFTTTEAIAELFIKFLELDNRSGNQEIINAILTSDRFKDI